MKYQVIGPFEIHRGSVQWQLALEGAARIDDRGELEGKNEAAKVVAAWRNA